MVSGWFRDGLGMFRIRSSDTLCILVPFCKQHTLGNAGKAIWAGELASWWELSRVLQKHKQTGRPWPCPGASRPWASLGVNLRQSSFINVGYGAIVREGPMKNAWWCRLYLGCWELLPQGWRNDVYIGHKTQGHPESEASEWWGSIILPQISTTFRTILLQQLWWTNVIYTRIFLIREMNEQCFYALHVPNCSIIFLKIDTCPKRPGLLWKCLAIYWLTASRPQARGCLEKYGKVVTPFYTWFQSSKISKCKHIL